MSLWVDERIWGNAISANAIIHRYIYLLFLYFFPVNLIVKTLVTMKDEYQRRKQITITPLGSVFFISARS